MKTIIAGSRNIYQYLLIVEAIKESGFQITEVVSGCAKGVDELGERWARENSVPLKFFPAQWTEHGRAAGPRRNQQMAEYAEALVAVTNGSKGTADMIAKARARGLKVFVKEIKA